jgi:murein DD-endopeptidase MepM/ murein hydrolase activator NlpD
MSDRSTSRNLFNSNRRSLGKIKTTSSGIYGVKKSSSKNTNMAFSRSIKKIAIFFDKVSEKSGFFSFLVNFFLYVFDRTRVILVLVSAVLEVVFEAFDSFKSDFVAKMYWGRGNLFQVSVQLFGFGLLFLIFVSFNYHHRRAPNVFVYADDSNSVFQDDLIVENTSTNTQSPENRGRVDLVKYVVRSGDTLGKIAQFYGVSVDTIMWANNLSAVHLLHPGEVLMIPPGDGILIKVKSGDTVASLAKKYSKYNVSPQTIVDANMLEYPFTLETNQTIFIPNAKPATVYATRSYTAPIQTSIVTNYPQPVIQSNVNRFVGWPVASHRGRLTQCYSAWHNGIDIADGGAPDLVASAPGTVIFAGCQSGSCPPPGSATGGYGLAWTVKILHPNGFSTVYGHMNRIYVNAGEQVVEGQHIGQMGQTGTAFGIHVHFMVIRGSGWSQVNPAMYMKDHVCGY